MTSCVILVPVLDRPQNVAPLLESIAAATIEPHRVLFIGSPGDEAEHAAVRAAGAELLVIDTPPGPGDYARKTNAGYRHTTEPLLFLAADDLRFHPGWLSAAVAKLDDTVHVVGTNDLGNAQVIAGKHSTHTLVTRSYCDERGTIGGPGIVLHEGYHHEYVDVEFVETAKARGAWGFAADSVVEHLHPHWGKAETDALYEAHHERMRSGAKLWRTRKPKVQREGRRVREEARQTARRAAAQRPTNIRRRSDPAPVQRAGEVTIVTASVPARSSLLRRSMSSVALQTVRAAHMVGVDQGQGVAALRNRLIEAADTEWIAFLDDDDVLDPHHLDTLLAAAGGNDVVIPHCRFAGDPLPTPSCCAGYCNRPYVRADLDQHGIFPITVLARRSALLDVGGFDSSAKWDDWDLWKRMAAAGARFTVVPEVTWTYERRHAADARTALLQRSA